ncbi:MAG: DNA-binding helix-turn-helix protein [Deltaproteobacteria bacterium]|nr:DNA-binding helix-turn-helix protein [Deltaproteobacteria bacterium]
MRDEVELDHYDVLEVDPGAAPDEIERSYRVLSAAYEGDSLATYSLFGAEEAEQLRDRIDQAYRVLSDPAMRRSYDAARIGEIPEQEEYSDEPVTLAPLNDGLAQPLAEPSSREVPTFDHMADGSEEESDEEAVWDGARLRRARLLRSVEVDDVASATKISPAYLRFLEEDRFDDLPAVVYVRGFVAAYARFLGLDANRVARSYSQRFEEQRRAKPRGNLLGRR